jgi:hypothetical protein
MAWNPNAKIPAANRSFSVVKKVVESVAKMPEHKQTVIALGGVQKVAAVIHGAINSAATMLNPVGALVQTIIAIFATFMALGGLGVKVKSLVQKILERLTELPLKV